MSYLGLPKHSFINFKDYQLTYEQSIRHHYRQFHNSEQSEMIAKKIETIPSFQSIKGQKVNLGNYLVDVHASTFAEWYLYYANEYGIDKAVEQLDTYFIRDTNKYLVVLWIRGVTIESTIELEDGISIVPLSEMPISNEKILYENLMLDDLPFHSLPQCAIIGECSSPKLASIDGTISTSGVSHEQLINMALSINLIKDFICAPYLSTTYHLDIPSLISARNSTIHQNYITGYSNGVIKEEHIEEINEIYRCLKLSTNQRHVFKTSINRILLSKCQRTLDDKILDLCIALEMLLLSKKDKTKGISLLFRTRGANIIGESSEQIENYRKDLGKIYEYRSKIAHTGFLTNDFTKYKRVEGMLPHYLNLAERIIKKIILNTQSV
jgi:Apea-like HEPN